MNGQSIVGYSPIIKHRCIVEPHVIAGQHSDSLVITDLYMLESYCNMHPMAAVWEVYSLFCHC